MKTLISVIIPVYNVERYIKKCVISVLNQDCKQLEILLIDDGSTDASGKICDELAGTDTRIRVFHQKNQGLSAARNRGIDAAKGDYLGFVDADDYIEPDMYSMLLHNLEEEQADMSFCAYKKEFEGDGSVVSPTLVNEKQCMERAQLLELLYKPELTVYMPVAWNKLYRRELFEGLRYPEGKYHEDEYLIHRLLGRVQRAVLLPDVKYTYVIHDDSIMGRRSTARSRDWIGALVERCEYYKDRNWERLYECQRLHTMNQMLWECKKFQGKAKEEKLFIQDMARQMKRMCRKEQGGRQELKYWIFSQVPNLYLRLKGR